MTEYKIIKNEPIPATILYRELTKTLDVMEIGDCVDLKIQRKTGSSTLQYISRYFSKRKNGYVIKSMNGSLHLWMLEKKRTPLKGK